ncbi:30S ribosomal protein S4 [Phorcysia thermohydrogeniphila]|uniref:Small ribosomal subunit protein uS4 n=1 Tax=Phorcysia thermohydrogeniphila TaxID=936138 RepID=A0A4R1GB12_9BACT|nr:30S ribosomal protein S4 [Phorcysia thermohydrogeniphila]RUM45303.1 MAG: 30S ribosomal protein S4 [Desulfurobacterium sp.]TCK05144.1 SSU ribosomal protein S4P [Phorcysia thermohydrogeniphila]
MGRYTGPKWRIARRLGVNIYVGEEKTLKGKSILDRRPYPPGQHGRTRRKLSYYARQLMEKQKVKYYYGVRERQFRRFYEMAERMKGQTGENLLKLLESRLDNVVYRLGFGKSHRHARQLVVHGHILVNGKKVDRPSYLVKPGDVIEVKEKSRDIPQIKEGMELAQKRGIPSWLELDPENFKGIVKAEPTREEIEIPIEEHLIVELYSK